MTNNTDATALNPADNEEWEEISLEDLLAKLPDYEDEESEIVMTVPYMMNEFRQWLIENRSISEKSADDYIRAYESAYESLYKLTGLNLYDLLRSFLTEIPVRTKCDLTKKSAPELVKAYVDTIMEEREKDKDSYPTAAVLAMQAYHDFIVDVAEAHDRKLLKKKAAPLPDEKEFISWLETERRISYDNAVKMANSVRNMDPELPSIVTNPMTFLEVLRALPTKRMQEKYIDMVKKQHQQIYANASCSYITIRNGFTNIGYYLNFLNRDKEAKQ